MCGSEKPINPREPILVTGGTRGIGSLITGLLHRQGQRVRVIARDLARTLTLLDAALGHPKTIRATFEAVWGQRGQSEALHSLRNCMVSNETKNSIP